MLQLQQPVVVTLKRRLPNKKRRIGRRRASMKPKKKFRKKCALLQAIDENRMTHSGNFCFPRSCVRNTCKLTCVSQLTTVWMDWTVSDNKFVSRPETMTDDERIIANERGNLAGPASCVAFTVCSMIAVLHHVNLCTVHVSLLSRIARTVRAYSAYCAYTQCCSYQNSQGGVQ